MIEEWMRPEDGARFVMLPKAEYERLLGIAESARELMPFLPGPSSAHIPVANLRLMLEVPSQVA